MSFTHRFIALVVLSLILVGCSLFQHAPDQKKLPENFRQLSARIFSSGEPVGDSVFRNLNRSGIKTIVSVDGAAPDVATAKRHGLAYVHLPIGYDGVPPATVVALDRVLKTYEGKILIHCHHGLHRGPSAAVIAAMIEGSMTKEQALHTLKEVGTSPDYIGLWRDVREFHGVPKNVRAQSIVEKADIDPLADSMVRIDHAFERIGKQFNAASSTQDSVTEQAVLLGEGFKEAIRAAKAEGRSTTFRDHLAKSEDICTELLSLTKTTDIEKAKALHVKMKADCKACHAEFRN
jgi:protein tyrosine phosphatase (PTP) superfamily phosphohydrolase (DUF442 family)/cytochrome c556